MPLTTMADLGHHNKKRDIVRFFMQNETKERIRCGVTNHALEVFKSDFDRRTDDPLTTFNKYRAHIESSRFRGLWVRHSRISHVQMASLKPSFFAGSFRL